MCSGAMICPASCWSPGESHCSLHISQRLGSRWQLALVLLRRSLHLLMHGSPDARLAGADNHPAGLKQPCITCTPCLRPHLHRSALQQAQAGSKRRVRRFGFARLHPLLQHAVSMDERQDVECTIRPVEDHLPADCLKLRVAPMRLRLATKSLVSLIVKILTITCAAVPRGCLAWFVHEVPLHAVSCEKAVLISVL